MVYKLNPPWLMTLDRRATLVDAFGVFFCNITTILIIMPDSTRRAKADMGSAR